MLAIKLERIGKKKQPTYRFIVTEKSRDPWDRSVEILGHFNPRTKELVIKEDRVKHWLDNGAQPTATVQNHLINQGLMKADKATSVHVSKKRRGKQEEAATEKKAKEEEAKAAEEAKTEEAPAAEEAPIEEKKEEAPAKEVKEEPKEDNPPPTPSKEGSDEALADKEAPAEDDKKEEKAE